MTANQDQCYELFNLNLRSTFELNLSKSLRFESSCSPTSICLVQVGENDFKEKVELSIRQKNLDDWFFCSELENKDIYVRWTNLFEFVVTSDGSTIFGLPGPKATPASFESYFCNQVLSFALLLKDIETYHATVLEVKPHFGLALMGSPGWGKSTLGGFLITKGAKLVTDDLLVVRKMEDNFCAFPSFSRIKLFPEIAEKLNLKRNKEIIESPSLNALTPKRIISLDKSSHSSEPVELKTIYMLDRPRSDCSKVKISILNKRQALLSLIKNTFNPIVDASNRVKEQFIISSVMVERIPVKKLSYPRSFDALEDVRQSIFNDIEKI